MIVYKKTFYYSQKFQTYNKYVKPKSYDKVWLNNKYIKIKYNCKLEAKFLNLF